MASSASRIAVALVLLVALGRAARADDGPFNEGPGETMRQTGTWLVSLGFVSLVQAGAAAFFAHYADSARNGGPSSEFSPDRAQTEYAYMHGLEIGFFVGGGACIAGGLISYIIGERAARRSSVTVTPSVGSKHAGAALRFSF